MRSYKLAMFGILMVLMLVVAACNGDGDDEGVDVPGTDEEETEEVEETEEMTEAETPEGAMTPEGTPEMAMTPEGTPGAMMTPEGTPEAGMGVGGEEHTVDVTLLDGQIDISLLAADGAATPESAEGDVTTLPSGTIVLEIANEGDNEHSLAIEPSTMTAGQTTPEADSTPTMGMGGEQELDEPLQPGDSTQWEVQLEPGDYVFYCPVDDHREQGMEVQVTVEDPAGNS